MEIVTIPCLNDNFAYLLICPASGEAAVVDPSESGPVIQEIEKRGVRLTAVLNTHHHWDHVGGNQKLMEKYHDLQICGHDSDRKRIPGQSVFLEDGDPVSFGCVSGHIIHNPGHTSGAVSYVFGDAAFSGDTLFAGGCGRLFEGTPEQMHDSLNQRIGSLPGETRIFFGHEYTENNLKFALSVEPDNKRIAAKLTRIKKCRVQGRFSTPTTIKEERETNPFMRCGKKGIQSTLKPQLSGEPITESTVFAVLRNMKDKF